MSASICGAMGAEYINANDFQKFFTSREYKYIRSKFEVRENPKIGCGGDGCKTNLFFGFFFDGTRNNYVLAEKEKTHSNVARLYDWYPGMSVPGVLPATTDW